MFRGVDWCATGSPHVDGGNQWGFWSGVAATSLGSKSGMPILKLCPAFMQVDLGGYFLVCGSSMDGLQKQGWYFLSGRFCRLPIRLEQLF